MTDRAPNELGNVYGLLTVVSRAANHGKKAVWVCKCSCGNFISARGDALRSGNHLSCGCASTRGLSHITHGMSDSPEYAAWKGMRLRCYNKNNSSYPNYGGRGITVCDEWRNSFESFFQYIGNRPSNEHSIDRIDNDGNYEPGNVRWLTHADQNRNQREVKKSSILVTYDGRQMTLAEACRLSGVNYSTAHSRLKIGLPHEEVFMITDRRK